MDVEVLLHQSTLVKHKWFAANIVRIANQWKLTIYGTFSRETNVLFANSPRCLVFFTMFSFCCYWIKLNAVC